MRKFTYIDNVTNSIIFECLSEDILDADKLFTKQTGKKPSKEPNIGCSIEKVERKK